MFAAPGVAGVLAGGKGDVRINGRSVENGGQHLIGRGDRILVRTPGGGGYGPAAGRDPALTGRDRALGYTARSGTKKG